ncbi:uncharacterized protein LOC107050047 isoform X1 [Gallus gallus]|uniref:uncharacterized protein LOC107050047 isoform X1 n=1 Tax=Gallus gallus TaxID=9031 RepID=UPI001AEB94DA|nr:uncharacterized protein LOC107050047 isoform X1 [Gallus gallus]XP_040504593.1 uncharacterized protein LOC107050047 isoform X1 [Gallus gallus]XP_040504594.2 uncharacterized protein LOC107050047 isoform X1 [Gallus gallus]XP_040504595.2 uncharacterized protein LOC107050047 isoform X1 [Gallus gallus]
MCSAQHLSAEQQLSQLSHWPYLVLSLQTLEHSLCHSPKRNSSDGFQQHTAGTQSRADHGRVQLLVAEPHPLVAVGERAKGGSHRCSSPSFSALSAPPCIPSCSCCAALRVLCPFLAVVAAAVQVLTLEPFLPHREIPSETHCLCCCNSPSLGCLLVRSCVVRSAADLDFFSHCPVRELIASIRPSCIAGSGIPHCHAALQQPSPSPFPSLSGIGLFSSCPLRETEATKPANLVSGISLQKLLFVSFFLPLWPVPSNPKLGVWLQPTPRLLWGSSVAAPPRGEDAFSPHTAGSMATWGQDTGSWVTWGSCRVTELYAVRWSGTVFGVRWGSGSQRWGQMGW